MYSLSLAVIVVVLITAILARRRLAMIPRPISNTRESNNVLQPGDIVYMSSHDVPLTRLHSYYSIWASAYMGVPWYHVFLVLQGSRVGHFVLRGYTPQLEHVCGNEFLQVGDLTYYISIRRKYKPAYLVFRRSQPRLFDPHITALCDYQFPFLPLIGINLLYPVIETGKYAHCNSYVGLLLQHMKLLPRDIQEPNRTFLPHALIQRFLPMAGYNPIGVFHLTS